MQLEELGRLIKDRSRQLEETLNQIEVYQQNTTSLRQRIIQEEQKLRVILSPAYLTQNKERAVSEEQVRVCCLRPSLALLSIIIHKVFVIEIHALAGATAAGKSLPTTAPW